MSLGNRIRQARKKLHLSQKELGAYFGVSSSAVSEWETDKSVPEFKNLQQLPDVLKVPAKWLLSGNGEPPPDDDVARAIESLSAAQKRQLMRFLRSLIDETDEAA